MRLKTIEGFITEGVFIIANITKCKEYYLDKEFDYDYPEGLADLLKNGIIHLITTDEDVEQIDFTLDQSVINLDRWEYQDSYNYLNVKPNDEIRLISHASFTQMCDNHNGDLESFIDSSLIIKDFLNPTNPSTKEIMLENDFPVLALEAGNWKVNVYTSAVDNFGSCADFFIHLEKMDKLDTQKITLQPIEYYGE